MRLATAAVMLAVTLLAACTDAGDGADATASPTPSSAEQGQGDTPPAGSSPSDGASDGASDAGPSDGIDLADVPDAGRRWVATAGLPVVGAVRSSTALADLAGVETEERLATCRAVAADLDAIAPPEVLSALAVAADAETATLLVADLRAKADLLAVCDQDGPQVEELVEEVARTHEIAVAWIAALGRGG